jgi:hypothetical protein
MRGESPGSSHPSEEKESHGGPGEREGGTVQRFESTSAMNTMSDGGIRDADRKRFGEM